MRVLHVIPSLATVDGGPVEVVRRLHGALPTHGVSSRVLSTDRRMAAIDRSYLDNSIRIVRSRQPARLNFAPAILPALRQELSTADIVHIHAVDSFTSSVAAYMAKSSGVPYLVQPHGAYDQYHRDQNAALKAVYFRVIDRRMFSKAAVVVSSSQRELEGASKMLGTTGHVIPLGVDPMLLSLAPTRERPGQLLFLGRVTEKKSVDFAIRAFARSGLALRGVRFVVAGPLDSRLSYDPREVAAIHGVSHAVSFLGSVDRALRAELLARSEVFVLPSRDESFGVAVAEAMAAACVVIATPEVGSAHFAARSSGVRLAERNEELWAGVLEEYFSDLDRLSRLGFVNRSFAQDNFEWMVIAQKFANLYDVVLSGAAK